MITVTIGASSSSPRGVDRGIQHQPMTDEMQYVTQNNFGWCCVQVVGAVGFANQRLALPATLDARVAAIINHCWASEAAARPSFAQVWIRGGCRVGKVTVKCATAGLWLQGRGSVLRLLFVCYFAQSSWWTQPCLAARTSLQHSAEAASTKPCVYGGVHHAAHNLLVSCMCCAVQVLESLRALKELPYTAATQPATGPEASTASAAGESSSGAATDSAAAGGGGEGSMQRVDSAASAGVTDASGPLGSLESPSATALATVAAATGGNLT
jgi:hypothetical protein